MSIVLASASPRRRELIELLGFEDMKIIPACGEEKAPAGLSPEKLVRALSEAKAAEIAQQCTADDVIVAADTIVWYDKRVFGKPHSQEEAENMLKSLSGNTHSVYTGVTVRKGERVLSRSECTQVSFRQMEQREIIAYIATGEPMDKAGAYGVQGLGSVFVRRIEGDFFNVMGLPLCTLSEMLKTIGVVVL